MSAMRLERLTVEHLTEPLGLATAAPRFSWVLDPGAASDARQAAYELEVRREDETDPLWATGRVGGEQSVLVEYAGPELASATRYRWRVRVWCGPETRAGEPTAWAVSHFETSLLHPADWVAGWVEPEQRPVTRDGATSFDDIFSYHPPTASVAERLHPSPYLRQAFTLDERPVRARLYATAHGIYQAELNGVGVGDQVLAPGYQSYDQAVAFQTYDVTDALQAGPNVLGVVLADGWFAGRISITGASAQYGDRLRASWQLVVTGADGGQRLITSDGTVRSSTGPLRYADLFIGEAYDARAELTGWSRPDFDDRTWTPVLTPAVTATLVPFVGEPVRRVRELAAVEVITTPRGDTVVDFGQVIAGRVAMSVTGPAGTTVTLEHAEILDRDGNYFSNIMGPNKDQTDVYVLAGRPEGETWEPRFTFHGFRYVRVTGYPGVPEAASFTAVVIASDLPETGDFACADERLTRLHRNVVWSQRGNFLAIPTDCPQRERAGWTGDIQIFAPTAATNAGVAPFLTRWLENLRHDQEADGSVPMIVPMPPSMRDWIDESLDAFDIASIRSAAGWGDAVIIVPWVLYQRYGDRRVLEENLAAMVAWVEHQARSAAAKLPRRLRDVELDPEQRRRQALLWNGEVNFGDWLTPSTLAGGSLEETIMRAPELTSEVVGAMFHAYALRTLAEITGVLGQESVAAGYARRAVDVREAFVAEYLGADGRLPSDLQGVYVLALAFDLVPDDRRAELVDRLVHLVHDADDHLDTGFLSVPYLLDVLWDNGHPELARTLLRQDTVPSWLYEVDQGATTIWEAWEAVAPDGTVGPVSLNHYAFGCVDDWLYRRVAGLQATAPGYRTSVIAPDLGSGLDWVSAHHDTPYGRLAVDWRREPDGSFTVETRVPASTDAILVLPSGETALGPGQHTVSVTL